MRFKDGVIIPPLHPAIEHALNVASLVWRSQTDTPPVVTSVGEGRHSETSLHYGTPYDVRVRAVDLRTRNLSSEEVNAIIGELHRLLGEAYDIIDEGTHCHIEYDPD